MNHPVHYNSCNESYNSRLINLISRYVSHYTVAIIASSLSNEFAAVINPQFFRQTESRTGLLLISVKAKHEANTGKEEPAYAELIN